jgi:hypothetical protein
MSFFSHEHFWFHSISASSILQFKGNGHLIPLFYGFTVHGRRVEAPGLHGINRRLVQTRETTGRFYFDVPSRAVGLDLNTQCHGALFIEPFGHGRINRLGIGRTVSGRDADAGF